MKIEIAHEEETDNDFQNICDKLIIEVAITPLEGPQPLDDWD